MDDPFFDYGATIVPVRDVAATVRFYEETLGFHAEFIREDGAFAIVRRGSVGIQLSGTDDPAALKVTAENIAIYITVHDVDGLYESLRDKLEALPAGRLRQPFNQAYGMREFHVKDPDGCLLFFGADIAPDASA